MRSGGGSTHTDLVGLLEQRILSGEFQPGELLPSERKLSERYAVSRSGVREALRVLAERQLVAVRQGLGTYVTEPTTNAAAAAVGNALRRERVTARDVITGRTILEREAAATAARVRTDDDLAEMRRHVFAAGARLGIVEEVREDLAFHLAVARAAHNPVIETMFRAIAAYTAEMMLRSLADRDVSRVGLPQHREILEAIEARDAERAESVMVAHLRVAAERYGRDLDASLEAVAEREMRRLLGGSSLDELLDRRPSRTDGRVR